MARGWSLEHPVGIVISNVFLLDIVWSADQGGIAIEVCLYVPNGMRFFLLTCETPRQYRPSRMVVRRQPDMRACLADPLADIGNVYILNNMCMYTYIYIYTYIHTYIHTHTK